MIIYKISEDFEDCVCYATEQGVVEVANNDREVDGEIRPLCLKLSDAISLLNDKGFNVDVADGVEFNGNYIVIPE